MVFGVVYNEIALMFVYHGPTPPPTMLFRKCSVPKWRAGYSMPFWSMLATMT